jgi:hypothetical protein
MFGEREEAMSLRLWLGVVAVFLIATAKAALAQQPWEEPQDASEAINQPDRYAWRLFVALSWPADIKQKKADAGKPFGDAAPGPVVWETWRNVNNNASDTTFRRNGSDPGPWLQIETSPEKLISDFDDDALQLVLARRFQALSHAPLPAFEETAAKLARNETRVNQSTYEFIRANGLYNLDGQIALYTSGKTAIEFPVMAKEVKAQWRKISDAEKHRYHWAKADDGTIYGLTALHIITKDLPNWFWATFEHIDNKASEGEGGRPGNPGWQLKSRDRAACTDPEYDCERIPSGFGLEGTKWENYRLRGTQIDFVDSRGRTTLLANSHPEGPFQLTSSCITCHARATISAKDRLTVFACITETPSGEQVPVGNVGIPNSDWFFESNNAVKYTQLDFVWSLLRARRSDETIFEPPMEQPCQ